MGSIPLNVTLIGSGQVGRALAGALRARGVRYRLIPYRGKLPTRAYPTDVVLICVRDSQVASAVERLIQAKWVGSSVVAHVSGILGLDVLAPLQTHVRAIGLLHPFSSIRSIGHATHFAGSYFVGEGNRVAIAMLRRLVRALDGEFLCGAGIDRPRYHMAAALLANGSIGLLRTSRDLLTQAGVEPVVARKMLLGLGQSVFSNVQAVGIETALTGPVRRGDGETIRKHLELLKRTDRQALELYCCLLRVQLQIVRELRELEAAQIRALSRVVKAYLD